MVKKMKSIGALLLALCMALMCAACDFGGSSSSGGGNGGGGNGGALADSVIYVFEEDGELVKGMALELGNDGKCYFWDGGEKDLYSYMINGSAIVMVGDGGHVDGEIITGTIAGDRITLEISDEQYVFVKYTGSDWKGEGSGGSSSGKDPTKPGEDQNEKRMEFVSLNKEPGMSVLEAIELVIEEQFEDQTLSAEYVSHTASNADKKIIALNMPDELAQMSPVVQEWSVRVKFTGKGGELVQMFPTETVEQTVYTVEVEERGNKYYFFGTAAPQTGERMTKSYAEMLTDYSKYENCTLTVEEYVSQNGGTKEFEHGKRVEMTRVAAREEICANKSDFDARNPNSESFYFMNTDAKEECWSRTFSEGNPSDWNKEVSNYEFIANKEREFTSFLTEQLLPIHAGFFTATETGFALMIAGENGAKEPNYSFTVSDGYITSEQIDIYGSPQYLHYDIALSDFGKTVVTLPEGAEVGKELTSNMSAMVIASESNTIYAKQLEKIGAKMGIKVKVSAVSISSYRQMLMSMKAVGNLPDIIMIPQSEMKFYITNDILADISGLMNTPEYAQSKADLLPALKNEFVYDKNSGVWGTGASYGVPIDVGAYTLGYNKTLLEERRDLVNSAFSGDDNIPRNQNGSVKMPWEMDYAVENYTLDQFAAMTAALSTSGKRGCEVPDIEVLTHLYGGSLLSADRETLQLDQTPFKQAAEYTATLIDTGAATGNNNSTGIELATGNYCFAKCYSYRENFYNESLGAGNWGAMPWPTQDGSTNWKGVFTANGIGVSSTCKNKADAVALIMGLLGDQVQSQILDAGDTLPVTTSASAEYEGDGIFLDILKGKGCALEYTYTDSSIWMESIMQYITQIINAGRGSAHNRLYSDAQYSQLNARTQEIYDQYKNG